MIGAKTTFDLSGVGRPPSYCLGDSCEGQGQACLFEAMALLARLTCHMLYSGTIQYVFLQGLGLVPLWISTPPPPLPWPFSHCLVVDLSVFLKDCEPLAGILVNAPSSSLEALPFAQRLACILLPVLLALFNRCCHLCTQQHHRHPYL